MPLWFCRAVIIGEEPNGRPVRDGSHQVGQVAGLDNSRLVPYPSGHAAIQAPVTNRVARASGEGKLAMVI